MRCECNYDNVLQIIQGDTYKKRITIESENGQILTNEAVLSVTMLLCAEDGEIELTEGTTYSEKRWLLNADTTNWSFGEHQIRYKVVYTDGTIDTTIVRKIIVIK